MYRIKDWALHFENAESRKIKGARWLPLPNKHDGKGFRRLTKHAEKVQILCAWTLILQVASKCPVRGDLADENGPLTALDLADMTDFPLEIFILAFQVLQEPRFGWIEDVPRPAGDYSRPIPEHPDAPGASPGSSGQPGNEGKGTELKGTELKDLPPSPRDKVPPHDAAVTAILREYPKTREREGGRVEQVHVGEGDRGKIADFLNANPDYPLLDAVRLYAKATKRPKNLREWLLNPTAREIVLKALAAEKQRDSPPPLETGPIGAGPAELAELAALAKANGPGYRQTEQRRAQNVGT